MSDGIYAALSGAIAQQRALDVTTNNVANVGRHRGRAVRIERFADGRLVTIDGLLVEPAVTVPTDASSLTIGPDGTISALSPGSTTAQQLGQLQIARFTNPGGLEARPGALPAHPCERRRDGAQPRPGGRRHHRAGLARGLERRGRAEMIDLISSQRAYEIDQRVIQAADEMLRERADV